MSAQPQSSPMDLQPLRADLWKLFQHVKQGDLEAVRRDLAAGTPVNFVDPASTDSPLMAACRKGFTEIVKLCLDYGAKNDPHPDFGQTALHAAVANGHFGCAATILRAAAESDADHVISNLTDQYGQTPLHCAALMGSVPLTELLLRHGARIDCVDSYGQTALHLSAGSVNKACLAVLLDQGGDEVIEVEDIYGNRPLHHAVYHGRLECTRLLLETAADVTARNAKGLTPYTLATMQGHHQIGLLLLEYRDVPGGGTPAATPVRATKITPSYQQMQLQRVQPRGAANAPFLTPPSALDDSREFMTPFTSARPEQPRSAQLLPDTPAGLYLGAPELRRHTSNDSLLGQSLPRPHTVGSPSLTNKAPGKRRSSQSSSSSSVSSAMSSPQADNSQRTRAHSQSFALLDMLDASKPAHTPIEGDEDDIRVIPQLSKPLFVRETSNQSSVHDDSRSREEDSAQSKSSSPVKESHSQYYYREEHFEEKEVEDSNVLFTPTRKAIAIRALEESYDAAEGAQEEFAEPLEIFSWCERDWHVYMTEQGDVYYLDIAHQHSQWDDPRIHGLIFYNNTGECAAVDLPPDSPAKLSDVAPPLSPALRSPSHISPSLLSGAARSRLACFSAEMDRAQTQAQGESARKVVQRVFTFEEEGIACAALKREDGTPSPSFASELDDKSDVIHIDKPAKMESSGSLFLSPERPAQRKANVRERMAEAKSVGSIKEKDRDAKFAQKDFDWIKKTENESKGLEPLSRSNKKEEEAVTATSRRPSVTQKPTSSFSAETAEEVEEQARRYVEMIRAGKSLHDVRLLLESEQRSADFVRRVLSLADDLVILDDSDQVFLTDALTPPKPKEPREVTAATDTNIVEQPKTQSTVTLDGLKEDPQLGKYVRMAKMGVPPMNVISKMKLDGLNTDAIAMMQSALGISVETKKKEEKKEEKMKWQLMPEERLKNSIWAFAVLDEQPQPLIAEQELRELEQLFLSAPAVSTKSQVADKLQSSKPAFTLQLLEGKRAQNIAIGLVPFKTLGSHVDVIKAICSLDNMDGKLSIDNLENFKTLLPTEAEVKRSFLLKNASHPAEIFIQSALIFYPELPLRLDAFIICLGFDTTASGLEKRMRIIMDVVNQIVSSPKLAKILQKLLVVSKVMLDPNSATSSKVKSKSINANETKQTILDQLLQVSNTKGVDKKTSLLDYLVKNLYDKNDENLLEVIDDLAQLADNTLPLSSLEAFQEYEHIQKQLSSLEKEYERTQPSDSNPFSSPTAKTLSDHYCIALEEHIVRAKERLSYIVKRKVLLSKKIRALMEYFGEDPKKTDTAPIFDTLKEFRRALLFSKEAVEWKLSRAQHQS